MQNFWLKARRGFLKIAYPFSRRMGEVHSPWSQKKISSRDYRAIDALIKPGDVVLSLTQGQLVNAFIPGFWSHAAIYAGDNKIIEAIGKGVVETDMIDAVMTCDYVMVRRPTFATEAQRTEAVAWARTKLGSQYDLFFNQNNDAFYCSELVWMAYQHSVGPDVPFTRRQTLGVDTVSPDDIGNADKHWITVYASKRD